MNNFAIGILTCNRTDFFKKCYESIAPFAIPKCVVNNFESTITDSELLQDFLDEHHRDVKYFWANKTNSIAYGKNKIIKWFLEKTSKEWLFIVEDDIIVQCISVFDHYIRTAKQSGFKHLMFGLAGPNNFQNSIQHPILMIGKILSFYRHCVGAFCLYHRDVLDKVGLMDERMINCFEHVEHSWRIAKAGFIPATFGFWPDALDKHCLIDQDHDLKYSTMQRTPQVLYNKNVQEALKLFQELHGFHPYQKLEELNKLDEHNQITFDVIEQSQRIFKT